MTRKPKVASVVKETGSSPDQILLAKLTEQYAVDKDASISFADILKGLGMNDRNTKWRNAWKSLEQNGLMESSGEDSGGFFTSGFRLTAKGVDEVASDEYKQAMTATVSQPKSNEELHEQIKAKLEQAWRANL